MNKKRLEEIKKHMRLYAPKNIHKELAELFSYIQKLERTDKVVVQQRQGSLLGNVFDWQKHLIEAYDKSPEAFKRYYMQLGLKEDDAINQVKKARSILETR